MKRTIVLLIVALLLWLPCLYSQPTAYMYDVEYFSFRNLHDYTDSTGTAGYVCCYEVKDKLVDGKKFAVQTFDYNLNKTKIWSFTCTDKERLLATSFNGNDFITTVLDFKKKLLFHKIYNAAGESERQFVDKLDANSEYYLENNLSTVGDLLYKLGDKGYLSIIPTKHNDVFTYDVNIFLKSKGYERKIFTPETDVKTQRASFVGSTGELLLFYVFKKKVIASNKYESNLIGIDATTGEKKFEVSTKEGDAPFLPLKVVSSSGQNEFTILGNYFKENGRVKRTNSAGLCLLRMNDTGKIIFKTITSWKEKFELDGPADLASDIGEDESVGDGLNHNIKNFQLHDFIQTLNGDLYIIGGAYPDGVDAEVTAGNILLAGASLALGLWAIPQISQPAITITDLVLLHANSNLQIDSVYRFAKKENRSMRFDIDFVNNLPTQNQFFIAYKDYNQGKGDDKFSEKILDYQNGSFTTVQDIFTTNSWMHQIFPASDKKVMLAEYYLKQKQIVLSIKQLQE